MVKKKRRKPAIERVEERQSLEPIGRIEDYILTEQNAGILRVPLAQIVPDKRNVRQHYTKKDLLVLAHSIAVSGQIEPVLSEKTDGKYRLVCGHRRYYASLLAYKMGWMERDYMLVRATRELPKDLRLKIQIEENEYKEKVPPQNVAEALWGRYKITLAREFQDPVAKDLIARAEDFWDIPESIRSKLTLEGYSRLMDRSSSTVRDAFKYVGRLHGNLKQMVEFGSLSYSSAVALTSITEKSEQRRLVTSLKKPKERVVRDIVKKYLQEVKDEEEGKEFLRDRPFEGRVETLRNLSHYISQAERLLKIWAHLSEIEPSLRKMGIEYDGKKTTPKKVISRANELIGEWHTGFLENPVYARRWEFAPKRTSLEDLVKGRTETQGLEEGKGKGTTMDLAEYSTVLIKDIRPNPFNIRRKFNQEEIDKLADSIKDVGLIHPLVLMKTPEGYIALCGNRRYHALQQAGIERVPAAVLPELPSEQQEMLMYDEDIFETVDIDARSKGITRQWALERKRYGKGYSLEDFCQNHARWSLSLVRDAIAYSSLPPEIHRFYIENLITYRVAVDLAQVKKRESQKDFAITAAISRQSHHELLKTVAQSNNGQLTLIPKEQIEEMMRDGQRRKLIHELQDSLAHFHQCLINFTSGHIKKFMDDYYLTHKFQRFVKLLQETA